MKNKIVGLKEFRTNTENYIAEVKKGESFIVVRRSRPILKISPPEDEAVWERVADLTAIRKDGVSAKEVLKTLRKLNA